MAERNVAQRPRYLKPRSAVNESKDGRLRIVLEMPGVCREDLEVKIESNELTVVGRRPQPEARKYVLRERPQGDFVQSFTLDETVDQSKVEAVLEKGLLTLMLDLKEQVKPRTIKVRGE